MTTGHDLPPAEAILRFGDHLRHELLEGVDRDPGAIGASLIATSALRWLRAALAAGDADVAEALGLKAKFDGDKPGSIHNRCHRRFVTDWTEA